MDELERIITDRLHAAEIANFQLGQREQDLIREHQSRCSSKIAGKILPPEELDRIYEETLDEIEGVRRAYNLLNALADDNYQRLTTGSRL